jgi:hypothetical protein
MRARLPAPRLRAKASQTLEVPCSVSRTSARCGVWPGPLRHSALSCWSNERTASAASVSSSSGEDNSSVRWRTAARLRASASSAGSRSAVRVGCSKTAPARGKTSLIRGAPKEGGVSVRLCCPTVKARWLLKRTQHFVCSLSQIAILAAGGFESKIGQLDQDQHRSTQNIDGQVQSYCRTFNSGR